ncbi:hypothetical protein [Legionella shakespearei]|uniref:Uncharacterized protein n=1 Tax=Legionella shakespearei DSM 23087 TaxID=1122169 RepID=A0A0W0YK65_9GAMM|nr:hypothetical protein [Legionella shakespearei]KTD57292.1 hypothetical protein Lsha_2674 [Legionella shakespearei DSM 23087]
MRKKYRPDFFYKSYLEDNAEHTDDEQYQREDKNEYGESFYRRDCQKATGRFKQQIKQDMDEALADIHEERYRMKTI